MNHPCVQFLKILILLICAIEVAFPDNFAGESDCSLAS